MNNFMIVGRLLNKRENLENHSIELEIAVKRSYKNIDGIYETDLLTCLLWDGIAKTTLDCCRINDIVGIKGKIQSKEGKMELIAEKLTFLSTRKEQE